MTDKRQPVAVDETTLKNKLSSRANAMSVAISKNEQYDEIVSSLRSSQ
jgi:hypothetical protein